METDHEFLIRTVIRPKKNLWDVYVSERKRGIQHTLEWERTMRGVQELLLHHGWIHDYETFL